MRRLKLAPFAQMDILDVLLKHVHGGVSQVELCQHDSVVRMLLDDGKDPLPGFVRDPGGFGVLQEQRNRAGGHPCLTRNNFGPLYQAKTPAAWREERAELIKQVGECPLCKYAWGFELEILREVNVDAGISGGA